MQITSVHVNPADCNLLLTASNDWEVKLCDLRMLHSISNAAAGPKSESTLQELAMLASSTTSACVFTKQCSQACLLLCRPGCARACAGLSEAPTACQRRLLLPKHWLQDRHHSNGQ